MADYKTCSDCRYWTGHKDVIGRECRNPKNQAKWAEKARWNHGSATVAIKPASYKACKQFDEKEA